LEVLVDMRRPPSALGERKPCATAGASTAEPVSSASTIGSNQFGFWFRIGVSASGCRSLPKKVARRDDARKAAVQPDTAK
jgi:hypothetical protein